ncbi:TPA: amino acid transporter [Streptococcus suis]|uniref:amino acid transporter n=1 Tax=Streptococcus suis TaxID=1307 RepID=UPI0003F9891D|nr:amino acid transporter [Streptococcus suis]MDW8727205.1 amino acid transporter [Streptococcus suis]NJW41225.1 amino acid transporter [Streptococcus suis]NQJ67559.1 amino acid transporter [Streptococcus suis]NQL78694.1 amino acid transporter [Streptococcus suis]HEL2461291.1 amino acid transporter [Streptococcus suis]
MFDQLTLTIFKTIFSRRDTKIFLSFCLLPILVPVLSGSMEALDVDYTKSFLSFLEVTLQTQYRLTLPILIFSILISSVFREEIDSGMMFLYKDIKRFHIFNSKIKGLLLIYALYLLGTSVATMLTYYVFLVPKFGVSFNIVPVEYIAFVKSMLVIASTIILNVITVLVVTTVSVRAKTLPAVLSGVLFTLLTSIMPLLTGLKYLVPTTYANSITQEGLMGNILVILGLFLGYSSICYFSAKERFEKMEF